MELNITQEMSKRLHLKCRKCGKSSQSSYIIDEKGPICDQCFKLEKNGKVEPAHPDDAEWRDIPRSSWPGVPSIYWSR